MALVERLTKDASEPETRWMAVHEFFASITELLAGQLTAAQIQNYYQMTAEDLVDWNKIAALAPAASQVAARAMWLQRIHAVFLLGERHVPSYSTPAEVRTRLGI